jgi:ribosome maturation factor RimP
LALQDIVAQTVAGLGYELVELERSAGGTLRVTIDFPWQPGEEKFVNVEDCERVTRQLQYTLEVEEVDKPGQKVSKKREPAPVQVLGFTLDELKEARLAPIVDFKGRRRAGVQE